MEGLADALRDNRLGPRRWHVERLAARALAEPVLDGQALQRLTPLSHESFDIFAMHFAEPLDVAAS